VRDPAREWDKADPTAAAVIQVVVQAVIPVAVPAVIPVVVPAAVQVVVQAAVQVVVQAVVPVVVPVVVDLKKHPRAIYGSGGRMISSVLTIPPTFTASCR
jgi:hypothetical protein